MSESSSGIKTFAQRQPLLFALLLAVITMVLYPVLTLLFSPLKEKYVMNILVLVGQLIFAVAVLSWLGWRQKAGFNAPSQWRRLSLLWLPVLLALVDLAELFFFRASSVSLALYAVLYALLTAASEEAFSRGLTLQVLLPYGPVRAAVLSGIIFGLLHLNNLFVVGFSSLVFIQAIGAGLMGIGFAAYRLRINTLWPLIVIHACYDLATDIALFASSGSARGHSAPGLSPLVLTIALIVPGLLHAGYGLFLLLPRKQKEETVMAAQI